MQEAPDEDVRLRLVAALGDFGPAYLAWVRVRLGGDQLTQSRLRLLMALRMDGPRSMRALADELFLTPRAITALVDALAADGLVERRAHPTDRRITLVELTPRGEHDCAEVLPPRMCAVATLFDALEPEEQRTLLALLERLTAALRATAALRE